MFRFTFIFLSFCVFFNAKGQLMIDTSYSPYELVSKVLLGDKSGLFIENVQFTGKKFSIAKFKNPYPTELIDEGIILSTGNTFDARGPNQAVNTGVRSYGGGDQDLQAIATGVVTDAAVLEFDLLALRDSIAFEYVFASEEYPEYVDKGVNDIFGFFIKEIGGRGIRPLNIARLPNQQTVVSIDNVNHRVNEEYFLRSDFLEAHTVEFWEKNRSLMIRAQVFEFDGFTTLLKATMLLSKGKKYHLKIAIADVGDRFYDSAVFLKAKSMKAAGNRIPQADSIVADYIATSVPEIENLTSPSSGSINFSMMLHFNNNEAKILEDSFVELKNLVKLLESHNDLQLEIIGHTDNVGSQEANQELSEKRAEAVKNYLLLNNIEPNRIRASGRGESLPIANNELEDGRFKNRRVAFELKY